MYCNRYHAGYLTIFLVSILAVTRSRAASAKFISGPNDLIYVKEGDDREFTWVYDLGDDKNNFEGVRFVQYIGKDGLSSEVIATVSAADDKIIDGSNKVPVFKNNVTWTGNFKNDTSKASFRLTDIRKDHTEKMLALGLFISGSVKIYKPFNLSIGEVPTNVKFTRQFDNEAAVEVEDGATYDTGFTLRFTTGGKQFQPPPELTCKYSDGKKSSASSLKIETSGKYECVVKNELGEGGRVTFLLKGADDPDAGAQKVSDGVIAGSVIAAVFVIGIIIVVVFIFVKKKRGRQGARQNDQARRSSPSVHPEQVSAP